MENPKISIASMIDSNVASEIISDIKNDCRFHIGYDTGYHDAIEKACELYRKELEQAELIIKNVNPKGLGLIDIDASVKKFKQAMENYGND